MASKSEGSTGSKAHKSSADAQITPMPDECFIIMPISDQPGYDTGHFSKVYEDIFKPACLAAGFQPTRADDVKQSNLIHLDILKRVVHSPMAICDLSSRNANVLFELGLRQAFDKPTILVKDEETPDIFDIAPIRYTGYRRALRYREVLVDQAAIEVAIRSTWDARDEKHNVNSLIRLLELTSPASITEGGVQDPSEFFQILMAEVSQLRREVRRSGNLDGSAVSSDKSKLDAELAGRALKVRKRVNSILSEYDGSELTSELRTRIQAEINYIEQAIAYYNSDLKPEYLPRLNSVLSDLERLRRVLSQG
jgi:hypothetical protein